MSNLTRKQHRNLVINALKNLQHTQALSFGIPSYVFDDTAYLVWRTQENYTVLRETPTGGEYLYASSKEEVVAYIKGLFKKEKHHD